MRLRPRHFHTPGVQHRKLIVRIGAVSYLNTKPLICDWDPDVELILDLPSRLADRLNAGDLDIALIPSAEFLRSENLAIVSDACIACRGPVRSVQILFRKPPQEVQTLALDEGSRTSALLAQVLLAKQFGITPKTHLLNIDADYMAEEADAVVIIGDRAMSVDQEQFCETWDLGEFWNEHTGLPFVFAVWATHHPSLAARWSDYLQERRDAGLLQLSTLAAQEAGAYSLSEEDCFRYFDQQLHFQLGSRELAGLDLFRKLAVRLELLPTQSTQLSLQPL